jgi:hypothetical protein
MSSSKVRAMWMTLDLLVAREWRKSPRDLLDELEEWLESIRTSAKIDSQRSDDKTRSTKGTTPTLTRTEDLPKQKKKKVRQNVKSTSHHGPSR